MCYSGICAFEDYMGDCKFPLDEETTKRYPNRLCHTDFSDIDFYSEKVSEFYKYQEVKKRKEKIEHILNKSK